jgi:hypothetical protein
VIGLTTSREPISRSSVIHWAEIVAMDPKYANDDWKSRSEGRMAVRLLTRADCSGMPEETDENHLTAGTRVAVLDLRVFVPEVISVLNTFARDDFIDQLNQIPFIGQLIGLESASNLPPRLALPHNPTDPINQVIGDALENSEIVYLKRLGSDVKAQLAQQICSLKSIQSLYGTQLEAFAAALSSSVHCTQGPPGTGKVIQLKFYLKFNNELNKKIVFL